MWFEGWGVEVVVGVGMVTVGWRIGVVVMLVVVELVVELVVVELVVELVVEVVLVVDMLTGIVETTFPSTIHRSSPLPQQAVFLAPQQYPPSLLQRVISTSFCQAMFALPIRGRTEVG